MKKLNFFFLILSLFPLTIFAQMGIISGKVIESETGFEAIGAEVVIQGTTTGMATDLDGKYRIDNLEPGTYNIECSYVGFETQVINEVIVKAGENTTLDISIGASAIDLDLNIEVTAKTFKNTEASLITIQRKSPVVLDGIAASQISKSGDSDVASAVKRVTGVTVEGGKYVYVRGLGDRYSKTTLNGSEIPGLDPNKNTVQMDLFPSSLIDNILVYKTFAPNLPGDFTGGYVDIATKDFPEEFTLNLNASLSYNTEATFNKDFLSYEGGKLDFLGFDDGTRAMPESVANTLDDIPFYAQASSDPALANKLTSLTNAFPNNWSMQNQSNFLNQSYGFSIGNQVKLGKMPLGFIAALTYQNKFSGYDEGQFGIYELTGNYDQVSDLTTQLELEDQQGQEETLWGAMFNTSLKITPNNKIGLSLMRNQSAISTARNLVGRKQRDEPDDLFQTRSWRFLERGLTTAQLKGKHVLTNLNNFEIDWKSAYSISTQDDPDLRYFTNRYNADADRYFIKPSSDRRPTRFYRDMKQSNIDNKLNLSLPFKQWSNLSAKAQMGGSMVYKDRTFNESRFSFNNQNNRFDGDVSTYFNEENLLSYDAENAQFANNGTGAYVVDNYEPANNYEASQLVGAAYAMVDLPITKKIRLITGARMEKTSLKFLTYSDLVRESYPQLDGNTKILDNLDVLPSMSLNFEFTEKVKLRSAYSRTLARPTFREVAPFASFDVEGGFLFVGNPDLERTIVDNSDLRFEFYPSSGEMISISSFYKRFNNHIERTFNPEAPNGELTLRNVDKAFLLGGEVEFRKKLDFVQALKHFSLALNFSYIYSRADIDQQELIQIRATNPTAKPYRTMFGQSPYVGNALLSYRNEKGTQANLAFNIIGKRISVITIGGTPNIYEMPRPSLNFNISQKLGERFMLKFGASNLLNSKNREVITFKDTEYPISTYNTGMNFSVGVGYSIK